MAFPPPALAATDGLSVRRAITLADSWYPVWAYEIDHRRNDGTNQRLALQVCHRQDSVAVLLFAPSRGTVILVRQFRLPPLLNGHPTGMIIEAAGGVLDGRDPAEAAVQEVLEETGYGLSHLEHLASLHPSPCLVTEKVHLYLAEVNHTDRVTNGGGVYDEGEDIETVEMPLDDAMAMVEQGEILDAKTVLLLFALHSRLHRRAGPVDAPPPRPSPVSLPDGL